MTEFVYPSYQTPGDILVRVDDPADPKTWEVLDYDDASVCFYISEFGFPFMFEHEWSDMFEEHPPGVYVIEGTTGTYRRGDGWTIDDDVDFYPGAIRPATEDEIRGEGLGPNIDPEGSEDA